MSVLSNSGAGCTEIAPTELQRPRAIASRVVSLEPRTGDLHADRHPVFIEPGGNGDRRQPGDVLGTVDGMIASRNGIGLPCT